jgi:hypothetical protein
MIAVFATEPRQCDRSRQYQYLALAVLHDVGDMTAQPADAVAQRREAAAREETADQAQHCQLGDAAIGEAGRRLNEPGQGDESAAPHADTGGRADRAAADDRATRRR